MSGNSERDQNVLCAASAAAPTVMITKLSDYKRWVQQGRQDILRYATVPPVHGYGDLWKEPQDGEEITHCPLQRKSVISISAPSRIPNRRYAASTAVNGHTEPVKRRPLQNRLRLD